MMKTFSEKGIEAIKPGPKDVFVWDFGKGAMKGLGVRVKPSGVKSYVLQYRNKDGVSCRMTFGKCGVVTLPAARRRARIHLGRVAEGGDPAREERAKREAKRRDRQEAEGAITLTRFFDEDYLPKHAMARKKPRSVREDEYNFANHIRDGLGRMKLAEITGADVTTLHADMAATPYAANRTRALLHTIFDFAELLEKRPEDSNPCRRVKPFKETARQRFLSPNELMKLADTLDKIEREARAPAMAIAAIRALIFTGARRGEIVGLKWGMVDLDARELRLPDSKTGAKTIHLNAPARELLDGLERGDDDALVFPGRGGKLQLGLHIIWKRIRAEAGLPDLRIHDLRHSFATTGVATGESLVIIGKLLGHRVAQTTSRYSHVASDPAKAAAERIGDALSAIMEGGRESAEVVELPTKRVRK